MSSHLPGASGPAATDGRFGVMRAGLGDLGYGLQRYTHSIVGVQKAATTTLEPHAEPAPSRLAVGEGGPLLR